MAESVDASNRRPTAPEHGPVTAIWLGVRPHFARVARGARAVPLVVLAVLGAVSAFDVRLHATWHPLGMAGRVGVVAVVVASWAWYEAGGYMRRAVRRDGTDRWRRYRWALARWLGIAVASTATSTQAVSDHPGEATMVTIWAVLAIVALLLWCLTEREALQDPRDSSKRADGLTLGELSTTTMLILTVVMMLVGAVGLALSPRRVDIRNASMTAATTVVRAPEAVANGMGNGIARELRGQSDFPAIAIAPTRYELRSPELPPTNATNQRQKVW